MRRLERMGAVTIAYLAISLVATVGAMTLATRPPGLRTLGLAAAGRISISDMEADVSPTFSPVSPEILRDLFGPAGAERLLGPSGSAGDVPGSGDRSSPSPASSQTPPGQEPAVTEQVTEKPDLRIEMSVDKSETSTGDTLRYVITVTNAGKGSAKQFAITSHVPEHTTLFAPPDCEGPGVAPDGDLTLCGPGSAAPGEHGVVINSVRLLEPGKSATFFFKVLVNLDAPKEFVIRNHAHVKGPDVPARTSNEVSTRVR